MIRVFIETAAVDESPYEDFADCDDWIVGNSGHLSVGVRVVNEFFSGLVPVAKTYAPGTWRWVKEVEGVS